jgi:N-acetylglucosamine malate deacetylase 1
MKILLLSPHTDDVELGCGGGVTKFLEDGHDIYWVVFSTAEESLPPSMPKDSLLNEFNDVLSSYRLENTQSKIFNYQVRNLDRHRQEILEELIRIRNRFRPNLVIGPSTKDYHQDHQVVAHEMIRAFKSGSSIISYELPWNHVTFDTQLFIKLQKSHLAKKCEVLQNYKSQLMHQRNYFCEEYLYGLAKTRGIQCNAEYAEAFEVVRWML